MQQHPTANTRQPETGTLGSKCILHFVLCICLAASANTALASPDDAFVASPIPDQAVSTVAELLAGVEPSVTVSNLEDMVELAEGVHFTVSYSGNQSLGSGTATVTGIGDYAGKSAEVAFVIGSAVVKEYFAVSGGNDSVNESSVSGTSRSVGWSTTRGGTKAANGITAANTIYYFWDGSCTRRSPPSASYASPPTSAIVVEPGCTWKLTDKILNKTLTLSNVVLRAGASLVLAPAGDTGTTLYRNTIGGTFSLAEGASLVVPAKKTASNNIAKQYTLSATVSGRGAVLMPTEAASASLQSTLANQITGDLSGFTGDIGTWNGGTAVSMELVNAASIPGDPAPGDLAYVVVSNSATLIVDQDWPSPTNRVWLLGDSGTPTISVPAGVTVTVRGDLVGSAGFNKAGAGDLVLTGASPDISGPVAVQGGRVLLTGAAAALRAAERIAWTESGGECVVGSIAVRPIPDQTVTDLALLAAGICPPVTVSDPETDAELALGTDYTVAYGGNTACGVATATVTGIGDYAGAVREVAFTIHTVKEVSANLSLSADEDWRAFESVDVAAGATIDLMGHSLALSGLGGAGEITDSVGGGELRYDVPASSPTGYEATISGVSLTGRLRLVKTGAGTLTTAKYPQTYAGGTEIASGILRYGCANKNVNATEGASPFGTSRALSVGAGGVLDPAGSYGWGSHAVELNGGMVSNTVGSSSSPGFNPVVTIAADSAFATDENYRWTSPPVDLRGHALALTIGYGKTLEFSTALTNGALNVVRGGWLRTYGSAIASTTLDATLRCALDMQRTWSVRDYHPTYASNYGDGTVALNVHGVFTPDSDYFYGPTMRDGSAIDLSAKTGAWAATSLLTFGGNPTTKFAANASVAILLGERTPSLGERVVSWTESTMPAASVSLTNGTFVLRVEADGLYVDSPRAFHPSFLPDIATAASASDVGAAIAAVLSVTNLVTGEGLVLGADYSYSYDIIRDICYVTVDGQGDYDGIAVVRAFSIGAARLDASDFYCSMEIAPSAGKVTAALTNFPVLVRLSESAIGGFHYGGCRPSDLRFALPDGTLLAHEIDYWNPNGESTVWVNVPELTSNTVIRAYWGLRPGREPLARDAAATWTDYVGVWHFSEACGVVRDSSGNGYHSTNNGGGTVSNVDARVGLARDVAGTAFTTTATNLADAAAVRRVADVSQFTVSGWTLSTVDIVAGQWPKPMRKSTSAGEDGWYVAFAGSPSSFCGRGTGPTFSIVDLPTSVYGNWVYMSVVFSDATCRVFADGALVKSYTVSKVANSPAALLLGGGITGRVDEFRIRDGVQSAAYVSADYATQADPEFLTYGKVRNTVPTVILLR